LPLQINKAPFFMRDGTEKEFRMAMDDIAKLWCEKEKGECHGQRGE
jgi:hypothetical protein